MDLINDACWLPEIRHVKYSAIIDDVLIQNTGLVTSRVLGGGAEGVVYSLKRVKKLKKRLPAVSKLVVKVTVRDDINCDECEYHAKLAGNLGVGPRVYWTARKTVDKGQMTWILMEKMVGEVKALDQKTCDSINEQIVMLARAGVRYGDPDVSNIMLRSHHRPVLIGTYSPYLQKMDFGHQAKRMCLRSDMKRIIAQSPVLE